MNPDSLAPCPTCDGGARQFGQTNAGIFKRCPRCDGRTEVPAESPDSLDNHEATQRHREITLSPRDQRSIVDALMADWDDRRRKSDR